MSKRPPPSVTARSWAPTLPALDVGDWIMMPPDETWYRVRRFGLMDTLLVKDNGWAPGPHTWLRTLSAKQGGCQQVASAVHPCGVPWRRVLQAAHKPNKSTAPRLTDPALPLTTAPSCRDLMHVPNQKLWS